MFLKLLVQFEFLCTLKKDKNTKTHKSEAITGSF